MARNRWSNITAYHTVAEITDEVNSINNKYKEVRLTDDEFEDMYRLGYTLGTSAHGAFMYAMISDYNQYKSGKNVNGQPITQDSTGNIIKVIKTA